MATGEVVAVTATDVERIGGAFDVAARFAGAVVAFVGVAIVLLSNSVRLGALVLIGLPLLSLVILPVLRPLERRESATRAKAGQASELAADTVAGLRVLRGVGGEEMFVRRFREASQQVRAASVRAAGIRATLDALQVALPGVFVVAVTWLGARAAVAGDLDVGELVAFYGYTAFLVLPLRTATEAADKWTRAKVAAGRVVAVLTLRRSRDEASPDEPPTPTPRRARAGSCWPTSAAGSSFGPGSSPASSSAIPTSPDPSSTGSAATGPTSRALPSTVSR